MLPIQRAATSGTATGQISTIKLRMDWPRPLYEDATAEISEASRETLVPEKEAALVCATVRKPIEAPAAV